MLVRLLYDRDEACVCVYILAEFKRMCDAKGHHLLSSVIPLSDVQIHASSRKIYTVCTLHETEERIGIYASYVYLLISPISRG